MYLAVLSRMQLLWMVHITAEVRFAGVILSNIAVEVSRSEQAKLPV